MNILFVLLLFAVWYVVIQVLSVVINSSRANRGADIQDELSAFMTGLALAALGVIAALHPQTRNPFKKSLMMGGLCGMAALLLLYKAVISG